MNEQDKIKQVNKGYMLGLSTPIEFSKALSEKMKDYAKNSQEKGRWQALSDGFDIGLAEQLKQRKQDLEKAKTTRGRTQERTR